ncbi:MAG: isoprenylcysteine carboxylmethyltransferase family protein [Candidatus Nanoarchaeia archaeon]|nr:isoprenylcysteine carboxylmethyltransferase family protein [Candidatus Nanoarchaeia archaeon]
MKFTEQGTAIFFVCLPFGILGFVLQIMFPGFTHIHFERISQNIGFILLITGLILWFIGFLQLMRHWGHLVTTGFFKYSRNPLYASIILFVLPSIAFLTCEWFYLCLPVVSWVSFMRKIPNEEKVLFENFGNEYLAYKAKVNRFFPKLM